MPTKEVKPEVAILSALFFGVLVVVFFLWRFARTHQLYRFSLKVHRGEIEDTSFEVGISREFLRKALFGSRSIPPRSFLIRALVYVFVAMILYPFRGYGPELYLGVSVLIILYGLWCIAHWASLRRLKLTSAQS